MYLATQREEFRVYNGCDVEALVQNPLRKQHHIQPNRTDTCMG